MTTFNLTACVPHYRSFWSFCEHIGATARHVIAATWFAIKTAAIVVAMTAVGLARAISKSETMYWAGASAIGSFAVGAATAEGWIAAVPAIIVAGLFALAGFVRLIKLMSITDFETWKLPIKLTVLAVIIGASMIYPFGWGVAVSILVWALIVRETTRQEATPAEPKIETMKSAERRDGGLHRESNGRFNGKRKK